MRWTAGMVQPVDEKDSVSFSQSRIAPNSDMTLLSRSMRSGPREGTTSAVTVRVILLRVKGKSRNPKTLIGSPFAARSGTAAGGTGFPGHPREFHPCQKCTPLGKDKLLGNSVGSFFGVPVFNTTGGHSTQNPRWAQKPR